MSEKCSHTHRRKKMGELGSFKEISSVSNYIEAIFDLRNLKMSEYSLSSYWFFRGQKNSLWGMTPNAFRNDVLQYEYDSIETAIRQRPYDFQSATNFEILTKLQHYGLGTRLLDVTLNPLVALYFASEKYEELVLGRNGRGKYVSRDGKIVYRYGYGHKLSELDVRIASTLPFIEFAEGITLSSLFKELCNKRAIFPDEQITLEENNYEKFIHAIQRNSFVISSYSNERLTRQNGAFIIPSAIKIIGEDLNGGDCLVRKARCDLDDEFEEAYFIVPADKKESIRDELDFLNINEATLFPELEHQLVYLQNRKLPNPGQVEIYEDFSGKTTRFADKSPQEEATIPHLEPHPDIQYIVEKYFSEDPTVGKRITQAIEQSISVLDWWTKDSMISRMNRDITRILQEKMSMQDSKVLANKVVKEILASPK